MISKLVNNTWTTNEPQTFWIQNRHVNCIETSCSQLQAQNSYNGINKKMLLTHSFVGSDGNSTVQFFNLYCSGMMGFKSPSTTELCCNSVTHSQQWLNLYVRILF